MKKVHLPAYREYVKGVGSEGQSMFDVNCFAFIRDGQLIDKESGVCFANLDRNYQSRTCKYDYILLQVNDEQSSNDKNVLFTYYEWLFNYSLFRHCFVSKNVNRILKDRMIVIDPNQDSKLVINAMVASRMSWEDSEDYLISTRIGIWYDMVMNGTHPAEALTLCHMMGKDEDGYKMCGSGGHELLDSHNETSHLNFIESKLNLEGATFNEVGGYKSIQSLFKSNRINSLNVWSFVADRWGKIMKDSNPFSNPKLGTSLLNRDAFLGTIKEITTDYSSKLKEMGVSVVQ